MNNKNKKIILIEPAGAQANVFAKFMRLPLMGPLYLGTILDQAGYNVKVYNENVLGRKVKDSELSADILSLTLLTPSASRGYEIARRFKTLNPHGKVIIGGVHATFNKEEAIKHADQVAIGEGEERIIEMIEGKINDRFVYGDNFEDIKNAPSPDFKLLVKNNRLNIYPLITSRGCPFDCDFCSVTQMFGRRYRTNPINRVIEDCKKLDGKRVFIYDDNFTANVKRSHELMDRLISEGISMKWSAQVRVDVARDENLVSKMAKAGCKRVYVGFESVNPKTLENFNKKQSVADIEKSIKVFHDNNIRVHGMFIFGSDEDDKDVFEPTLDFCNQNQIDTVQYMALTPLPGTYTYNQLKKEGRLLHHDWERYDGMHVVFKPKKMTPFELQKGIVDTYKNFYSYIMASRDAMDASFDFIGNLFHLTLNKMSDLKINRTMFKFVGKAIVNRWTSLNKKYMEYLAKVK
jgi:radical SAM superfamily enzyme YgiQ (UPF0313 family)